jgi:GTP-binding protein EngB required for normal cell division
MSSSSSRGSVDDIEISNITIKAPTNIASINLSIESTAFEHKFDFAQDKLKEITLPLSLLPSLPVRSTPLIVGVRLDKFKFFNQHKKIEIKRDDLLSSANRQEYRTTVNGIEAIIEFILPQISSREAPIANTSRSVTDEIFEICPRFRVLVIGRTGAGKSSLINNTFGVTDAHISHGEVGECDINNELFSVDENKRFVLHDSKGFEPGDANNFETVIAFLNNRKRNPNIKDRVHAVWLCFSIPVAGDRLFETGSENFLQKLSEGELGEMPIIAIFTKYDKLVDHINFYYDNPSEERINAGLNELCIKPFAEQIRGKTKIPNIAVSTAEEYKWTLHKLTQLTTKLVGEYLSEDVALLSAVAQQVSPTVKLDAVIAVGKKRYWGGLAATIKLPGSQLQTVLQHIHQDIVRIWNLQDPLELLDSSEFKTKVVSIVNDDRNALSLKNMAQSISMLGALAGIVSALSGPAAPIVIPIAAVFVIGHWTVLLVRQAGIVLQQLMIYIVTLTIVMQNVFAVTTSTNKVVTRRLIDLAIQCFLKSSQKEIISSIKEFMQRPVNFSRDAILQKITELLKSESNQISPNDLAEIKNQLRNFEPDDR